MQSKLTTKIIIDKLKLDVLFRLNVSGDLILKRIKGEEIQIDDPIVNDLLDSLIDVKTFDNWGGAREGAGRKPLKTNKNNQLENQDEKIKMIKSRSNQDADKDIDNINNKNINNNISTTHVHNALEVFGNSFKATDAVVGVFDKPDGTTHEGIRIKNPRLMAFVRQRFDSNVLSKVSDWAIDHNQRGHTYNATSLLKLLCKFQSNVEPTINFNSVQSEFLTFEYKQPQK